MTDYTPPSYSTKKLELGSVQSVAGANQGTGVGYQVQTVLRGNDSD